MPDIYIILVVVFSLLSLQNKDNIFPLIIIAGFLQDPIRKLTPGEPVILTTTAIAILFIVFFFLVTNKRYKTPGLLAPFQENSQLKSKIVFFILLVLIQTLMGYATYQSLVMSSIGLMTYMAIFFAVWLGWYYLFKQNNTQKVFNLFKVYIFFGIIACIGIQLSFWDWDWKIFKQVGEGSIISSTKGNLEAHVGFMRSPDIVAWHISTAICLLMIIISGKKLSLLVMFSPLIGWMTYMGLLTGRRKMLAGIVIFTVIYITLRYYFYKKSQNKSGLDSLIIGFLLVMGIYWIVPNDISPEQSADYVGRGLTVFRDAQERFGGLGLTSIIWAIRRFGWFGIGTGTTATGMQHFGGGVEGAGGAGEFGLGKIVVELGIFGLILGTIIVYQLIKYVFSELEKINQLDLNTNKILVGVFALLCTNIPQFIASSQTFGDPFVLIICGGFLGLLIAVIEQRRRRQEELPKNEDKEIKSLNISLRN